jgi:hypothetical protein
MFMLEQGRKYNSGCIKRLRKLTNPITTSAVFSVTDHNKFFKQSCYILGLLSRVTATDERNT